MTINDHLNKIFSLGFYIELNWNETLSIYYNSSNEDDPECIIDVLHCSYQKSNEVSYSYEDMVEVCCDFFYGWYNKNLNIIKQFDNLPDSESIDKLKDYVMKDVTKRVARELNLTDILG